jgi:hypothetical protein
MDLRAVSHGVKVAETEDKAHDNLSSVRDRSSERIKLASQPKGPF